MSGIYDELGVQKIINAAGTYTILGGSKMSEKTLADICGASEGFVQIRQLQEKINGKIAELTNNESAYVCNGAAAGIYLSIAAAIEKRYNKRFYYITKQEIEKTNIVMFKAHRNPYDLVVSHIGCQYKEISFPNLILPPTLDDIKYAIDENTVAFYYAATGWTADGDLPLESVLKITKEANIPVIVDAAAQLPPVENLWKFCKMGADVTLFSGGKDLRGPQSSGLVVGCKDFVDIIKSIGFPNYGIGRMLKVGREEMVGLYSAVKQYIEMDHQKRYIWCEQQIKKLSDALLESVLFKIERCYPNEAGQPIARAFIKIKDCEASAADIVTRLQEFLMSGETGIYTTTEGLPGIYINPMTLYENETEIIILKLKDFEKEMEKWI